MYLSSKGKTSHYLSRYILLYGQGDKVPVSSRIVGLVRMWGNYCSLRLGPKCFLVNIGQVPDFMMTCDTMIPEQKRSLFDCVIHRCFGMLCIRTGETWHRDYQHHCACSLETPTADGCQTEQPPPPGDKAVLAVKAITNALITKRLAVSLIPQRVPKTARATLSMSYFAPIGFTTAHSSANGLSPSPTTTIQSLVVIVLASPITGNTRTADRLTNPTLSCRFIDRLSLFGSRKYGSRFRSRCFPCPTPRISIDPTFNC